MPGTLNTPIDIGSGVLVPRAKIAAFKIECNIERWLDIWIIYGDDDGGQEPWVDYHHTILNVGIPPTYIHIENGMHPLCHGMALRQCPTCGKFFRLETECDVLECDGAVLIPWPGLDIFCQWVTEHNTPYNVMQAAMYGYLMDTMIPDLDTWELRQILEISDWTP